METPTTPDEEQTGAEHPASSSPQGNQSSETPPPANTSRLQRLIGLLAVDLWKFLKEVFSLSEGIDREGTAEGIRADVNFKGHGAWILIAAILMASIGLSVGNIPIIIGAMLISPLMGPILGIGLAAGTNDFQLLKKSMTNLGIMIVIGIVISALYFLVIPIPEINVELRDRTQATLLAIGVAFVGGAAGIIAGSRRHKSNVVPGVAIATALMPPLCTVGFGLATLRWEFFFGALYLFFINSVFIALPTFLYIRYLKFPMKQVMDAAKERRIRWQIGIFLLITMVPSAFIFVNVLQTNFFERDTKQFILAIEQSLEDRNTTLIDYKIDTHGKSPVIKIALIGDPISDDLRNTWIRMRSGYGLEKVELDIREPRDFSKAIEDIRKESKVCSFDQLQDYYRRELARRDSTISSLEARIGKEAVFSGNFDQLGAELKSLYPNVQRFAFANFYESNFARIDTISTVVVKWAPATPAEDRAANGKRLQAWLSARLGKQVRVVEYWVE